MASIHPAPLARYASALQLDVKLGYHAVHHRHFCRSIQTPTHVYSMTRNLPVIAIDVCMYAFLGYDIGPDKDFSETRFLASALSVLVGQPLRDRDHHADWNEA